MFKKFLITEKRWIPFRMLLILLTSISIYLIGLYDYNLYFYVWVFNFINMMVISLCTLYIYVDTSKLFILQESTHKHMDRISIFTIIVVGFAFLLLNGIGLYLIPDNFHPRYILNIERLIRLIMLIIFCIVCHVFTSFYTLKLSRYNKLHRNKNIKITEYMLLSLSCCFQALSISGIIFIICSYALKA